MKEKIVKSVHISRDAWEACISKGINISAELNIALEKLAKRERCPACGNRLKSKKPKIEMPK